MYLTFQQLCERLQLSTKTVNKLIADGSLPPPIVLGRSRRWRADDVDSFLVAKEAAIDGR